MNDIDKMKDDELRNYIRRDLEHNEVFRNQMKKFCFVWICFAK
ncbi:MAG: hypothetical protein ACFFEY_09105 [Candidatus Thorarchaeota archaeon]